MYYGHNTHGLPENRYAQIAGNAKCIEMQQTKRFAGQHPSTKYYSGYACCHDWWLMQPDAIVTRDLLQCAMLAGSHRRGTAAGLSLLWLIRDEGGTLPSIKFFLKSGAVSYEIFKQGDQ